MKSLLLLVSLILVAGCVSQTSNIHQTFNLVPLDTNLTKIALNENDVEGLNLVQSYEYDAKYSYPSSLKINAPSGYLSRFAIGYNPPTKELTNNVVLHASIKDAEKGFEVVKVSLINGNKIDIETIGDESVAYLDTTHDNNTVVYFRKNNLISGIILFGGNISEAVLYAKKVETKINGVL